MTLLVHNSNTITISNHYCLAVFEVAVLVVIALIQTRLLQKTPIWSFVCDVGVWEHLKIMHVMTVAASFSTLNDTMLK